LGSGGKGGNGGSGAGAGGGTTKPRHGIDKDGFAPPEARPSYFQEGTERTGVDGKQWVVVSAENGSSLWALPGQTHFFTDRAKREQTQRRGKKKRETKAAAMAAATAQSVARAAAAKAPRLRGGGGGGKHA
jgi:hypothetical protein